MSGKYFTIGKDTGYDIAQTNIHELTRDNQEQFVSEMAEHESDVYRQYSPFEFLAAEMNQWESRWNAQDVLWNAYEQGVMAGINQAVKERLQEIDTESME